MYTLSSKTKGSIMQGEMQLQTFEQFVRTRKHEFGDLIVDAVVEKVADRVKARSRDAEVIRSIDRYMRASVDMELERLKIKPVGHENYGMRLSRILNSIKENYRRFQLQGGKT